MGSGLTRRLHDQDHSGMENSRVAVVALEGGDGGLVGRSDGVESFSSLDGVVDRGDLRSSVCFRAGLRFLSAT